MAAVARLTVILRAGGLRGFFGYDAAVYFAASDALVHGRMPYRDFILLHPPGLMLTLTPFAWLTSIVSDGAAFAVANIAFALLGALNAVLVVRICRAWQYTGAAAAAGGLFYALWFGSVGAEYLTKLEALGSCLLLTAVLMASKNQLAPNRWTAWAAGAALGAMASVKIWWIVPAVAVLIWHAQVRRHLRAALPLLGGFGLSAAAINLPFFLTAPHQMWSEVVREQLGRSPTSVNAAIRLADLTAVTRLRFRLATSLVVAGALVFLVLMAVCVIRAWSARRGRPAVILLLVQLAVLLAAPSWFSFYADYLAAAAALTVAGAVTTSALPTGPVKAARWRQFLSWAPVVTAAAVTSSILLLGAAVVPPFHGAHRLASAVSGLRCVVSDSPMGLIEVNALSRGLAAGCSNWVDVTGRTYGPDKPSSARLPRTKNRRWQRDLLTYLRSGDAIIIVRRGGTGIARQTLTEIARGGVLARASGHTVYRVRH